MIAPAAPVAGVFQFDIGPGFDEAPLDGVEIIADEPSLAPLDGTPSADAAQPVGFELDSSALDIAVIHE